MPNRILREGLLDAPAIAQAGEAAEVLFIRLILVADDYGRFDGRVTVICRRCWPAGGPGEADVLERLKTLAACELVVMYQVDGKPYLFIPNFRQRSRAMKSKFPPPPVDNSVDNSQVGAGKLSTGQKTPIEENPQLNNTLDDGTQLTVKCQTGAGHPRTYSDSDSYSITRAQSSGTASPSAHSTANAQQVIAEGKAAEANRVPPPPELAELIARAIKHRE